jgi:hypothetical protein
VIESIYKNYAHHAKNAAGEDTPELVVFKEDA